jgi:uncharacterized phage protein gp47/JayE
MTSPVAPTISPTGIAGPAFADILAWLTGQYQSIFGADVYLGNDSQDGQLLAVFAKALSDCCSSVIASYNSFSPLTAQGAGLATVVKINGLRKLIATPSVCSVTVTGVAGTVISNGLAIDTSGEVWALPPSVTIPSGGSIIVTATCTTPGAISAAASTITGIKTPVFGWQSVTNAAAATPGNPVETDAALRARQSRSVSLPSVTVFDGIVAALANLPGVTRAGGVENNTNGTSSGGVPARSSAFVVEGGTEAAILQQIALKLPPGGMTYGGTSGTYTSPAGSTRTINYSAPTESTISVALTIKQLTGWSTAIEPVIAQAIVNYLNALPIGTNVSYTQLFVPAYAALAKYPGTYLITAMTTAKGAGSPGTADITIAWNEAAVGNTSNVTFTLI